MSAQQECDFLIVGGGILGITIAHELQHRHHEARVVLIDKEPELGLHASGRNSGVLHAGFYYTEDSLKARFTKEGNRRLTAYARERGLRLHACGKLVVVQTPEQLETLDELLRRGQRNGIDVQTVSVAEARDIEPRARTLERALFSPTTSAVDPVEILHSLTRDAEAAGVRILWGVCYGARRGDQIETSAGQFTAGYVVNAAGLYADQIARDFGFSRHLGILPFKGLYLYSDEPAGSLRTHVYPVPDLRNPFLGVHFTVTVDGRTKVGPTAIPALWREQYSGWQNFQMREFAEVAWRQLGLAVSSGFGFQKLALEEVRKYSRHRMVHLASNLVTGVRDADYRQWGTPGIRAQLVDLRARRLIMDFKLEGDDRSMHVLNAVSPAFTCSIPFASHVCDAIETQRRGASPATPIEGGA